MAKGEKRSNREPKKPKAEKKVLATPGPSVAAPVKPKAGAASAGSKK
jgi:hypothetical protein